MFFRSLLIGLLAGWLSVAFFGRLSSFGLRMQSVQPPLNGDLTQVIHDVLSQASSFSQGEGAALGLIFVVAVVATVIVWPAVEYSGRKFFMRVSRHKA